MTFWILAGSLAALFFTAMAGPFLWDLDFAYALVLAVLFVGLAIVVAALIAASLVGEREGWKD